MNKIERRVYTEDDIQFIKDNYQKGDDYLCKELSRGKGSVSSKRNSLGLRSPNFKKDSYCRCY